MDIGTFLDLAVFVIAICTFLCVVVLADPWGRLR